MKIKIWVLATCTEELRPALPRVFGDEGEAEAEYDKVMREEWQLHSPELPNETPIPYPGAREANRQLANGFATGDWCDWELTAHTIDIPLPPALQQAIAVLSGVAEQALEDLESGVEDGTYDACEANRKRIAEINAALQAVATEGAATGVTSLPQPNRRRMGDVVFVEYSFQHWQQEVAAGRTELGYKQYLVEKQAEIVDSPAPAFGIAEIIAAIDPEARG